MITQRIDFLESLHGCQKTLTIQRKENCYSCKGSGASLGTQAKICWTCNGKGVLQYRNGPEIGESECQKCNGKGKEIKSKCGACEGEGTLLRDVEELIELPSYLKDGGEVVFRDRGNLCERSKRKGNLIVRIEVEDSSLFKRKGAHIFSEIEITFAEGIVGSRATIETIWGSRKVSFKGLNKMSHLMTLPNYGVYNYEKKTYGNHYVEAKLVAPKKLTPEMEELYKELGDLGM